MDGRSDLERISIGQPDIWTKATLTSSIQAPLTNPPAFTVSLVCVLQLGAPRKMILFESLRWSYVINSKRRSAICEVSHSGPIQDTQPAIAKSWVESEKIHVDDGDGKTSRNLSWSCWKPWFPVGFPIEPIRDRQRLYRCTPTSWLNLRPLEQRRFLFKISVGGFFFIRLYMVLLSNIFGMNNMNRDYHNDGKSYEHLWARSFA